MKSHMSGLTSGKVPNENGIKPLQNGDVQMPDSMDYPIRKLSSNELLRMRQKMQAKVFSVLQQRQPASSDNAKRAKLMDVAQRLEEGLFKMASSKEAYLDPQTLQARLGNLIKYTQRRATSSSSVTTMIPTPGMHQGGNPSSTAGSTVDSPVIAGSGRNHIVTSAAPLGTNGAFFSKSDGILSTGYQHASAGFPYGSRLKTSSINSQRMTSQMIPTPGFSNNSANCRSQINMNTSINTAGCSAVDSPVAPPLEQQRHHNARENNHAVQKTQIGNGFRPDLQQKSHGLKNDSQLRGLGTNINNVQPANECRAAVNLSSSAHLQNSIKNHQLQQPRSHGEGNFVANSGPYGSDNLDGTIKSARSMANIQNFNSVSLKSLPTGSSSSISNQSTLHEVQQVLQMKPEPVDLSQNNSFSSSMTPTRETIPQTYQPHQFPINTHQFQNHQQFQQCQQEKIKQQLPLLNENAHAQPKLASSIATQVKFEPEVNHQTNVLLSQASKQFQSSKLQNQVQQSSVEGHHGGALQASFANGQHHIRPSLSLQPHMTRPMIHPLPLPLEPRNDCGGNSCRVQSGKVQDQQHQEAQDLSHIFENCTVQHGHENSCQKPASQNEAQINELSTGASIIGSKSTTMTSDPANLSCASSKSGTENSDLKYKARQRWLLLLHHARKCTAPEGKCQAPDCISVRKLLRHIDGCKVPRCTFPRCSNTKTLISHYNQCKDLACPVCVSVKSYLRQQARAFSHVRRNPGLLNPNAGSSKTSEHGVASGRLKVPSTADISDQQPPLKRLKVELSSQSDAHDSENSLLSVSAETKVLSLNGVQHKDIQQNGPSMAVKSEVVEVNIEMSNASGQARPDASRIQKIVEDTPNQRLDDDPVMHGKPNCTAKEVSMKLEKEVDQAAEEIATQSMEIMAGSKSCKPKIKGVSLTELFTPEQVRKHICGLRQWVGQSKAKAEKNQALERSMTENSCQLCAVERLAFEPPPIYCTACGARVKRNTMYYTAGNGEARQYICVPCYNDARGESIVVDGTHMPKARLEKKKHDEETEEWWVQCDKCEGWQHQICALFNGRRNDGGQAEYTCANCYIQEVESGERKPLPQSAVLGAKDLPRTILSDHIEQRLFKRLKQERQERAKVKGKSYDEVPGAEPLVVRVVSSVDKKFEVKPLFLELFREESYPTEFPYKSKAVLLFQKIEGVEVCLFGMYVQEFGTDCAFPNQRRVYLSYLDSVKYFRPDVKTVTGEALRTFVYHEILIGYLEYCKKRGFTSCYIWACPPLKGEDYILYCHPEIQKTPRSDKLREWYLLMLEKAKNEKVVVEWTNLYDQFFTQSGESRARVTAARLPYFDGDYWPGAVEDLICQMNQEDDGKKIIKKGVTKKMIPKRAARLSGPSDQSINMSKDRQLMQRLGETICPMKEDFIMVHLQHCCSHCCILMVSGNRWVCNQCDNFQICDKCYEVEQNREASERHPTNQKEKHNLHPVVITDVPVHTEDKDEILESEFFDTRQAFLSLCQGNHYQYETLRRAKHSSMMILYHLHNPTAPAFVTTCNVCQIDIETGQGWRCEVCPDFDACNGCFSKGINHPHKLTHHPSNADRDAQNKEARQQRVEQQRKMLDVLVHAAQCLSAYCSYVNCRRVKSLFRHGMRCEIRASGGCVLCKKMWYLLQIHARACKVAPCLVPRCRDLKEHWKRQQQQSDSRRRAAVMEMMRQRTAEITGTSG